MLFKEQLEKDIDNVFLNDEEYGSKIVVDGIEVPYMFDEDELKERQGTNDLAVSESTVLLYTPMRYFQKRKTAGEKMTVDGKIYVVDDWKVNLGMAEIALHRTTAN